MPFILRPDTSHATLPDRLGELHRDWRRAIRLRGLTRLTLLALTLALVGAIADRRFDLANVTRATGLAATLAGLAFLWRGTAGHELRTLRTPTDTAMELERRFPQFADALASAAEFAARESPSPLHVATIAHARRLWNRLSVEDTDRYRGWLAELFGVVLLAMALLAGILLRSDATVMALRWFDPYGAHPWPPRTAVELVGPETLMRGEPWDAVLSLRGVVPERIAVRVAVEGQAVVEVAFHAEPAERGERTLPIRLEPHRVNRPFRVQAQAGDSETPWVDVAVYIPPELIAIDGQPSPVMNVRFPRYTGLADAPVPTGSYMVDGLTGAQVDLRAAVDRPVVKASVGLAPDALPMRLVSALATLGTANSLEGVAALHLTHEVWGETPCRIAADGLRFETVWTPRLHAPYRLAFVDRHGLAGQARLEARWQTDPSPSVRLDQPGDALELLPAGTLHLAGAVDDPAYAIRAVALRVRVNDDLVQTIPLAEFPDRPKRWPFASDWPLSRFRRADGGALHEGDRVALWVEARDWDDVTWNKPPGRSADVQVRIVSPGRIEELVQRGLTSTRDAVERWRDLQKQATAATEQAISDPKQARAALGQAEAAERQIDAQLGGEPDGARAAIEKLRKLLADNPLPADRASKRVEDVARGLDRLGNEELNAALQQLEAARKSEGPPSAGALAKLRNAQDRAARTVDDLRERLNADTVAGELRQEAGALAREQAALRERLNELAGQVPAGRERATLPQEVQRSLAELEGQQDALKQRAGEWAGKLDRSAQAERDTLAKLEAARDAAGPAEAGTLAERAAAQKRLVEALERAQAAANESKAGPSLAEQMTKAGQATRQNQLGSAASAQQAAGQRLDAAREGLQVAPPAAAPLAGTDAERLQRELADLTSRQEQNQERADRLEKVADPAERQAEADAVVAEQGKIAEQARDVAERLRREGRDKLADRLDRARRKIDQARDKMDAGAPAGDAIDDALDRLDDAADEVKTQAEQAKSELQRAEAESLIAKLKSLRERQVAGAAETERVFTEIAAKGWSRPLRASLADVGTTAGQLAEEVKPLLAAHFREPGLERLLLQQATDALALASPLIDAALADDADDGDALAKNRKNVAAVQARALKRLDQLLALLQTKPPAAKPADAPPPMPMPDQPPPPMPMADAPHDAMPGVDKLKLLRDLQAELRERTQALADAHGDPKDWPEPAKLEGKALAQAQKELRELFERWNEPEAKQP